MFGSVWKKANGFGTAETPGRWREDFHPQLVMAANLAMFLNDPKTNLAWGATAGFLAGFGWVAMGIGIVSLFERRSWNYVLVNGGYLTVALVIMGAILGAWR